MRNTADALDEKGCAMAARRTVTAATEMTPQLAEFLRRLAENEQAATGRDRRPAFRLTRIVIAAALNCNVPAQRIAECLGTSVSSVRDRISNADAEMTPDMVEQLTGLTPDWLAGQAGGEATVTASGNYLASTIVKVLLAR